MKIFQNRKGVSYLACLLVSVGLFASSTALALSTQRTLLTTARTTKDPVLPIKTETNSPTKNSVLVRNTTAKTEPGPKTTTTTAPAQKSEDKKTIGRCWQRLMNMVREANHVHRKSTK